MSVLRFVRMAVAFVVVAGSLGLATVTATAQSVGSCPSDGAAAYSDVPESSFAYDDSRCLRELGISDAGDTYRPGDDMTRSEMAAFMANTYAVLTGAEAPVEDHDFTDVEGDPNADDIARISPNGLEITRGTGDGSTYSPNDPVRRDQMALFLTRLYKAVAGADADGGSTPFVDLGAAQGGAETVTAVGQLYALGVTTGTSDTTYSPSRNVTREEMASFVARMYRALDSLDAAPDAPTGVMAAISGDDGDSLDVSWDASEGADSYVVQWKSGDDDYSADNQRSVDGTSSNFDGLTQGTSYTFRVAAVNDAGTGDWSDEASASPAVAPGMVGDLSSAPGNGTLTLSWTAPEDDGGSEITGYVVSWRTGGQATADTADVAGDATGYTITGLDNTKSYSVWVAAMNAAGTGEAAMVPAGTDSTNVSPKPQAASAPQNFTVKAGNALLNLSWTAPADDGGTTLLNYTVQIRCGDVTDWTATTVSGSPFSHVATSQLQATQISGLTNGAACEVRIRANSYDDVDGSGDQATDGTEDTKNGPWAEGSATPATVPGEVTFTADNVTRAHQSLQITWAAPTDDGGSDITGYKISWSAGIPMETTVPAEPLMYTITG
ncbi:MAG: hypothetical protein F4125_01435, partial [Acidimicrobiaceae bacterium]|nr:hypothetical protein [Acidimicrobiaceae bacterium]